LHALTAPSPDDSHLLEMEKGTRVLDSDGNVVTLIEIREAETPQLPDNTTLLGNAYDFTPSGTAFSTPVRLTLGYDVNELPDDVVSIALAYYTAESGWVELEAESGVVAELGKQSARVHHLTIFAVLAKTTAQAAAAPPTFEVTNLSITPSESKGWDTVTFVTRTGEEVTITVEVTNNGSQRGSYTAVLSMNGIQQATKEISLNPGQTQKIAFTVGPNEPGNYAVEIGGLSGEFVSSVRVSWGLIAGLAAALGLLGCLAWYFYKKRTKVQTE